MSGLQEFIKDLANVEKYSDHLTSQALFIAGISACKSGENTESILKYLAYTQKVFEKGLLNNTNKTIIEFHFYKGEVNEAKKLLKNYKQKFSSELMDSQSEINSADVKATKPLAKMEIDEVKRNKNQISPISRPEISKKVETVSQKKIEKIDKNEKIEKTAKDEKIEERVKIAKISKEQVREHELQILDLLNTMRRIDEKEALRLRKVDEEKRLQAEIAAKDYRAKLEQEFKEKLEKELQERKRLEEEALKCIICKDKIKDSDLFLLDSCGHTLHKPCAKEFILAAIDLKKLPISCASCKVEITMNDIKANVSGRVFKQYEDLTFKHYMEQNTNEYNSCPTPKCSYLYELEDDVNHLECPQCKRAYCLYCRSVAHKGIPCGNKANQFRGFGIFGGFNQPQAQVFGVVKGQKLKACPVCNFWVEKGNDKVMKCRCGSTFCYVCSANAANCQC